MSRVLGCLCVLFSFAFAVPADATSATCSNGGKTTVCVNAPLAGALLSGTVPVAVTATGGSFTKVIFKLGTEYLLTDSRTPYGLNFDTTQFTDGQHVFSAYTINTSSVTGSPTARVDITVTLANGVSARPAPSVNFTPRSVPADGGQGVVVAAIGDGPDGGTSYTAVSSLIASWNPAQVLTLGDVYEGGSRLEFLNWLGAGTVFGGFAQITNPTPGNHEYIAERESGRGTNLDGYRWFYGSPPDWYASTVGGWRLFSLNSNCSIVSCAVGSPQYTWLQAQLAAATEACSLAIQHHPRLSTGPQGDSPSFDPLWRLIASGGVDVDLAGHDHSYQRWAELDANLATTTEGVTSFIVGTGGHGTQSITTRNDSRRLAGSTSYGALRLRLFPTRADYEFITTSGAVVDSGSVSCSAGAAGDFQSPTVPGSVAATASGASATVTWAESTDNVGVTAYQILRDGAQIASVAPTPRSYTDTAVTPGTLYSYTVRAMDAAGNASQPSAPATVTTAGNPALTFVAVADTHVLADTAVTMASNYGTAVTLRSDNSPLARSFLRFNISGTSGPITNATLRVWRLNTASHAGVSVHAVADTTWGETTTTWNNQPAFTAAAAASTGPVAAGPAYVDLNVTSLVTGNGLRSLMIDTASSSSISIESREGSHKPTLILQAAVLPSDTTPPSVPQGVAADGVSVTSVAVTWALSTDDSGVVAAYDVYRDGSPTPIASVAGPPFTDSGRAPATTYSYTVRARDAVGNASDQSTADPGTTLADTAPPSVPAGVGASASSSSSVTVSWLASTDNVAVTAYEVYRGGVLAATVNAPGLSFVDGGRDPSATYSYTVRAKDGAGNVSDASSPLASATTPAATPTTVTVEPVADAYVQDLVTTNNGTSTQLRLDASPMTRAYLKFSVAGLNAPPSKVELRVYANNTTAYSAGFSAWAVANTTWTETGITFANAPPLDAVAAGSTGPLPAAPGYRSIIVTPLITGNGTYSIALTTTSSTALSLASRQSTNRPQIVITT